MIPGKYHKNSNSFSRVRRRTRLDITDSNTHFSPFREECPLNYPRHFSREKRTLINRKIKLAFDRQKRMKKGSP